MAALALPRQGFCTARRAYRRLGAMESAVTVLEFESWVSDNYERLVDMAKAISGGHPDAEDVLHQMVEAICEGRDALPPYTPDQLEVGFFSRRLRLDMLDMHESDTRYKQAIKRATESFAVIGPEDTYQDTDPIRRRRDRAKAYTKRKSAGVSADCSVPTEVWDGPMPGNIRWRFQTLRDNKLFDQRAVESLRASIRGAAARYRHFGEHGYSFTEFGAEVPR